MKKSTTKKSILLLLFVLLIGGNSYGQESLEEKKMDEKPKYEGLQLKINDNWKINFSGQVNSHYVLTAQKEDVANKVKKETFHSLRNGFSQATLSFVPQYTFDNGTTVTTTFGMAFGLSNSGVDASLPQSRGFGFAPVEIRQASIRIATPKLGGFLIGRDFGLFGLDAVWFDQSLFGIGGNYSFVVPRNTTLAGSGYGYIFTDKIAQLNYTTPSFFDKTSSLTIGVYDPFASYDLYKALGDKVDFTTNPNSLGVHAKFAFNKAINKSNIYFSSSFISQEVDNTGMDASGIDAFLKLNFKGLQLSGYYYNTDGMGDAGLMFGSVIKVNSVVEKVKTDGYYAQATYKFTNLPVTLGVNYGSSRVKDKIVENSLEYSDNVDKLTNSIRYAFNSNLIVKSEFTIQGRHKVWAPKSNVFSLGAIFFF